MTVNGGYPAPGPQDREPPRHGSYAGPPPSGSPLQPPMQSWAAMPQQVPMLTAHKPGIVPLRPLQFGDILDGAIKAVRFNPKSMVVLSALVLGAFLIPSAAVGIGLNHLSTSSLGSSDYGAQEIASLAVTVLQFLLTTLATGVLSGLLIQVVSQAVLGRKPDLAQTWRSTRGRVWSLMLLAVLTLVVSLVSTAALIGPGILLLLNENFGVAVLAFLIGIPCLIAVSLFVSTKISMAAPAMVLEGHGVIAGLRRSFSLTKGSAFWRVLGITLLAHILAGVAGWLLGLPFSVIGLLIAATAGLDSESSQTIVPLISHLSTLLTGAITTPFVAAVTGLLYIDRRMRLEALDVVLLREAQTNPAPRI